MSDALRIDARGLSCPEPVLLTQNALREHAAAGFTVLVSSPTARDNVERTLQAAGRRCLAAAAGDGWEIIAEAPAAP